MLPWVRRPGWRRPGDRQGEFRTVEGTAAVQIELAEGPCRLLGAGPIHCGELRILSGVQQPVAVTVRSDTRMSVWTAGVDGGVKAAPVLNGQAHGGGELLRRDLLVAVGVHAQEKPVEQCALPSGNGRSWHGINSVAEGVASRWVSCP